MWTELILKGTFIFVCILKCTLFIHATLFSMKYPPTALIFLNFSPLLSELLKQVDTDATLQQEHSCRYSDPLLSALYYKNKHWHNGPVPVTQLVFTGVDFVALCFGGKCYYKHHQELSTRLYVILLMWHGSALPSEQQSSSIQIQMITKISSSLTFCQIYCQMFAMNET